MPRKSTVVVSPESLDKEHLVTHVPGVQGGAAILTGTRTPVRSVIALYRSYDKDIMAVVDALPHLSETQLRAALEYYDHHRAEIEADQRRQEEAFATLRSASYPV